MNENLYPFEKVSGNEYAFVSIGRKGAVTKVVTFEEIEPGIYNALLQDEVNGERLGDATLTNNGDAIKVINTTAAIIWLVLSEPGVLAVHIAGSTQQRNKLYQRTIFRELKNLVVLGQQTEGGSFEPVKDDESYLAFLVLPK